MEKKVETIIYDFAKLIVYNRDANEDWLLLQSKRKCKELAKQIAELTDKKKVNNN
jgi:hypothetical protein